MQYLGFYTAYFWSWLVYESAVQKPKHCLINVFLFTPLVDNWMNSSSRQKAVPIRTPSRVSSDASTKSDHGSFYINDETAAAANKASLTVISWSYVIPEKKLRTVVLP